jgi:putative ABC transport system ATP-binding protein
MNIITDLAHNEDKCVIVVTHSKKVSSYAEDIYGIADGKLIPVRIGKKKTEGKL